MKGNKLTPKQEKFCQEYVKDMNATQAAIRAGYSPKTADPQGPRLLGKVRIMARIDELKAKAAKRNEITTDRILEELKYIAFGRITDVAEFNGQGVNFKDSKDLPDSVARAINEVSSKDTKEGVEMKLKMYDKQRALSLLMDYTGMKKAPDQSENIESAVNALNKLTPEELEQLDAIRTKIGN